MACGAECPGPGHPGLPAWQLLSGAFSDAGIARVPEGCAVVVGSSRGLAPEGPWRGKSVRSRVVAVSYTGNALAGRAARALKAGGPALCVSAACASGAAAVVMGASLIRGGICDAVVAAGVDQGSEAVTRERFEAAGLVVDEGSAPLCRTSRGIRLCAAAGALLMGREDGEAVAYLDGVAMGTHPGSRGGLARDPERAADVLRAAIADAGLVAGDIAFVQAHGNGNPASDAAEVSILEAVFQGVGRRVPVVSSKGRTGHGLGGTSAAEVAFAARALRDGVVPGTGRVLDPYPSRWLRFPEKDEAVEGRAALVCAFGFWGVVTGVVLVC